MDRSFLKIMTFNVQGLFDPTELLSLDLNQKADAERRVRAAIAKIADLPEDDCPDIICLNEILFGEAAEICREKLSDRYRFWAWAAYSDTGDALVAAGVGGGVGLAVGGVPGAAVGAGLGALFEGIYTQSGGSAGIMIFSRARLMEFPKVERSERPKLRHFTETSEDDEPFSVLVGEYTDTTGDDAFARKGFLIVKARFADIEPFYVLATHLQAGYNKDDKCVDDIHDNGPDCRQHADMRRSEIDEIVRALRDSGLDDDAWKRIIITGDLNIRGEPDRRTFVKEGVSEWESIFDPDIDPPFPDQEGLQACFDGWHEHTKLASRYGRLPNGVDPGFTNFNVLKGWDPVAENEIENVHRGQRLDYIVYHRSFDLVPHVMRNRFRAESDHRSLEAHFGMICNWCQPSTADDVTKHIAMKHLWLYHPHEPYDRRDRFDWTFIPARRPKVQKGRFFPKIGDAPGTYAVAAFSADREGEALKPHDFLLFLADDLNAPASTSRQILNRQTSSGVKGHEQKIASSVEEVHVLGGPVYIRLKMAMGVAAHLSIRRLTGDTPETALGLIPWEKERTPWPTAGASSGATATVRWYLVEPRRHSMGKPYQAEIAISNPDEVPIACRLLKHPSPGETPDVDPAEPLVGDDGAEIKVEGPNKEHVLRWTVGGTPEPVFLKVEWQADKPLKKGTVCYKPQLTGFGDGRAGETPLVFSCVEETWGLGSDEMIVRIEADGERWQSFDWEDADKGEKIVSPGYDAMLDEPVWFSDAVTVEFVETGDIDGRERGRRSVTKLKDAKSRVVNETVRLGEGQGRYSFGGMLFRDYRPRRSDF